ncbi:MAG: gamma-glutamylcyclotransferase family protein [Niameybacter sp.]|uniref:gamma-glutamylcyclotransferase family protein n=1 Tax=Niameybacter sp. TaxID=2033640 RepID=UPI002FCC9E2B
MNKKIYAAYGSNTNLEQMSYRCPAAKVIGTGIVKDYRLTFRGNSRGVANIEPYPGRTVPVVIWEITEACEEALDGYEGYPNLYEKQMIEVQVESKVQEAMVYVMARRYRTMPAIPTSYYLGTIAEGYADNGIDLEILKMAHLECLKELK